MFWRVYLLIEWKTGGRIFVVIAVCLCMAYIYIIGKCGMFAQNYPREHKDKDVKSNMLTFDV